MLIVSSVSITIQCSKETCNKGHHKNQKRCPDLASAADFTVRSQDGAAIQALNWTIVIREIFRWTLCYFVTS